MGVATQVQRLLVPKGIRGFRGTRMERELKIFFLSLILLSTLFSISSSSPLTSPENIAKARSKRFITDLNIGNLLVAQLFPTAIRPTNLILLKLNVKVAE